MAQRTKARLITYGTGSTADLRVEAIEVGSDWTRFTLLYQKRRFAGRIGLIGRHQIYPILAAIAVGLIFDIPIEAALSRLTILPSLPGRMRLLRGLKESLILDDSFNASPASMQAALKTLALIGQGKKKMALLGKMADLGEAEAEIHADVGRYLVDKVDYLVTFGAAGQMIAQAALRAGLP
jgi:UDP-N-acetylmuramoyl-tripeptide--D-alanyl-D-alanine ligase